MHLIHSDSSTLNVYGFEQIALFEGNLIWQPLIQKRIHNIYKSLNYNMSNMSLDCMASTTMASEKYPEGETKEKQQRWPNEANKNRDCEYWKLKLWDNIFYLQYIVSVLKVKYYTILSVKVWYNFLYHTEYA